MFQEISVVLDWRAFAVAVIFAILSSKITKDPVLEQLKLIEQDQKKILEILQDKFK